MFPQTYRDSRAAFLDLAKTRGGLVRSRPLEGGIGRHGETLAMDMAIFGDPDAPKALLIIAGTHGLEGPPGAAVQHAFLTQMTALPKDLKIVAVHALNPWGFSHGSRTDEANIDINRNFLPFDGPLPYSPAYAQLHAAQCPDVWSDEAGAALFQTVGGIVRERGMAYLMEGMTSGQYQEPTGLNYGGVAPCWSNLTFTALAREAFRSSAQIGYVEWHSGFGDYGEVFHICHHAADSPELERAASWWGREAVTRNSDAYQGTDGLTPAYRGLLLDAFPAMVPHAQVVAATIEFGTFGNQDVLGGLMIDRWLKFGTANTSTTSREALEIEKWRIFSPVDPAWQDKVLQHGLDAQARAFRGLLDW